MLFAVKKAVASYHIDRGGLESFSLESDLHPKGDANNSETRREANK